MRLAGVVLPWVLAIGPAPGQPAPRAQAEDGGKKPRQVAGSQTQEPPFEEEFPRLTLRGLLDVRFARTDDAVAALDGGLGRTRYGGIPRDPDSLAADRSTLFRLSQAAVLIQAELSGALGAKAQMNVDAEPDRDQRRSRVDLIEASLYYRPSLSRTVHLDMRGGIFYPPVSLEHRGVAWTPLYTITPSALNSWLGEEIRTTGAELGLVLDDLSNELSLSAAVFGGNDPAGSLLAFRGFTLTDRNTGVSDRLSLAPVRSISAGGVFATQAPWVSPFREVDGRLGYFTGVGWERSRRVELSALHYDNRADQAAFDGDQYAWRTAFTHGGVALHAAGVDLLGQYLTGRSRMGFTPAGDNAVDAAFRAGYLLASVHRGRHRVSARYDRFEIVDQDVLKPLDDNQEEGRGWTFAYRVTTGDKHRLAFELLRVRSDRPSRMTLGLPREALETLFQASFQLEF